MENKSRGYAGFWWETLKESNYWKYLGVDKSIILKLIPKKWEGRRALDSVDSG
jgi:hypothetical protein